MEAAGVEPALATVISHGLLKTMDAFDSPPFSGAPSLRASGLPIAAYLLAIRPGSNLTLPSPPRFAGRFPLACFQPGSFQGLSSSPHWAVFPRCHFRARRAIAVAQSKYNTFRGIVKALAIHEGQPRLVGLRAYLSPPRPFGEPPLIPRELPVSPLPVPGDARIGSIRSTRRVGPESGRV